jgi:hypothetical protein
VSSMNAKLDDIHPAVLDLHTWKPSIEQSVESLRVEVGDLRARVFNLRPPSSSSPRDALPPLLPRPADAPSTSTATPPKPAAAHSGTLDLGGDGHGQLGHRDASSARGDQFGDLRISNDATVKGTYSIAYPGCDPSEFARGFGSHRFPPPPRVDFHSSMVIIPTPGVSNAKPISKCVLCIQILGSIVSRCTSSMALCPSCNHLKPICTFLFGRILHLPFALNLVVRIFSIIYGYSTNCVKLAQ